MRTDPSYGAAGESRCSTAQKDDNPQRAEEIGALGIGVLFRSHGLARTHLSHPAR